MKFVQLISLVNSGNKDTEIYCLADDFYNSF